MGFPRSPELSSEGPFAERFPEGSTAADAGPRGLACSVPVQALEVRAATRQGSLSLVLWCIPGPDLAQRIAGALLILRTCSRKRGQTLPFVCACVQPVVWDAFPVSSSPLGSGEGQQARSLFLELTCRRETMIMKTDGMWVLEVTIAERKVPQDKEGVMGGVRVRRAAGGAC